MKKYKRTKNASVIVLLSGGIDSSACVQYYLKNGFSTSAIFIYYEQLPVKMEESSAKKICSYYNINLNTIRVNGPKYCKKVEIKGRNAIFVLLALMFYSKHVGIISLGIHSGTPYYDCTENFSNDIKNILNGYSNGQIRFEAPFLKWNKNKPNLCASVSSLATLCSNSVAICFCFIIHNIMVVRSNAPTSIVIPSKISSARPVNPPAILLNTSAPIMLAIMPPIHPQ